jgi:hypothetical protein
VLVPPRRLVRWFENFERRHGAAVLSVTDGCLLGLAADGASARAALPWGRGYDGAPDPGSAATAAAADVRWGVLLVRKGGFAVAAGTGDRVAASKVGQRHVQGRTKAGGQSQQRFARRRENQAREAYAAAADHAVRVLAIGAEQPEALVCGGDRGAVEAVLADPRLSSLRGRRVEPWLAVSDPRRPRGRCLLSRRRPAPPARRRVRPRAAGSAR